MKIRSKQLWHYLHERGLLNATQDQITLAKKQYVREYKKAWKLRNTKPQKEIRLFVTIKDYLDLKAKATGLGFSVTKYTKELALASIEAKQIVPKSETLKKVLQIITMAVISHRYEHLPVAESLLLNYIKKYCA